MSRPEITTPVTAGMVRGALEVETTEHGVRPHRLPERARVQIPDEQLAMTEAQPAGVRLSFRTTSRRVGLDLVPTKVAYAGLPGPTEGVYDLVVGGRLVASATSSGGHLLTVDLATGRHELQEGAGGSVEFDDLPPGRKDVELWLPYTEAVELRAVRTDAPVEPAGPSTRPTWIHHAARSARARVPQARRRRGRHWRGPPAGSTW